MLGDDFNEKTKLQLEKLSYKLHWDNKLSKEPKNHYQIPFKKNTVTLPPKMLVDLEQQLSSLKREILKVTEAESIKMKRSEKYINFKRNLSKSKRFLKDYKLTVIPSDKTNSARRQNLSQN